MTDWAPITGGEADTINRARDALNDIAARANRPSVGLDPLDNWRAGRIDVLCHLAEWQLFQVLNHASVYGETLTDDVLHNRKLEV